MAKDLEGSFVHQSQFHRVWALNQMGIAIVLLFFSPAMHRLWGNFPRPELALSSFSSY